MVIGLIGDLHFGVKAGDTTFLEFQLNYLERKIKDMYDKGIRTIVQAGDAFDNRRMLDVRVAVEFKDKLYSILKQYPDLNIIFTIGNHNIFYREDNSVHNLFFLNEHPQIKIVVEHEQIGNVLYIGWINKNNQEEILKVINDTTAEYLVSHLELNDFAMYRGVLATHGMDASLFKKFKGVYTGHYHTVSSYGNINYIGSPYHITWMDYPDGVDRGWFELDTSNGNCTFHRNGPQDSLFLILNHDKSIKYDEGVLSHLKGKIVRVNVIDKGDTKSFNKFLSLLSSAQTIEYKINDTSEVIDNSKVSDKVDPSNLIVNIGQVISEYGFNLAQTVQGSNPDRVKSEALSIYQEAATQGGK